MENENVIFAVNMI